jgi:hypothetical protein
MYRNKKSGNKTLGTRFQKFKNKITKIQELKSRNKNYKNLGNKMFDTRKTSMKDCYLGKE